MHRYQINQLIQNDMQEQNKNNAIFLGLVFLAALVVFFTVVMLTYVGKAGWWSAVLPVLAIVDSVYGLVKKAIVYKKKMEGEK